MSENGENYFGCCRFDLLEDTAHTISVTIDQALARFVDRTM
jgi:hypothetical protein